MADLKHQVPIDAAAAKVYQACATQNGMRHWWTADSQIDEKVGGKAEFGFDKRGMVFRMNVKTLQPDVSPQGVCRAQKSRPSVDGMIAYPKRAQIMPGILHQVGVNARPEKVFSALTTIVGFRGWWQSDAGGNPAAGGLINFGFCDMKVISIEPDKLVHWRCTSGPDEGVGTEVKFRLDWNESQTFVLFKHAGWKEPVEFMYHCSTKWATFLLSLRDWVERGKGTPEPDDLKIYVGD